MIRILAILVFSVFALSAHAGKERLFGTWKSNKSATLAYLKEHTHLNAAQLEKVGTALGKMTVTFDEENATFLMDDFKFATKYTIYNEFPTAIMVESRNSNTGKIEKTRLDLEGPNSFWAPDDKIPGFKERFDRVPGTGPKEIAKENKIGTKEQDGKKNKEADKKKK